MADTNKKEYTSNLHPKGDLDTTVYPNVKSENIIDKDTTAYNSGKVPDSSLVQKSLDSLSENLETTKIQVGTNKTNIATLQGDVSSLKQDNQTTKNTIAALVSDNTQNKKDIAKNTQNIENLSAVTPTDINVDSNYNFILENDGTEITGQKKLIKLPFVYANDKFDLKSVLFSHYDNKPIVGNLRLWETSRSNSNYESAISFSLCWTTRVCNTIPAYTVTVKNGDITVHVGNEDYSFYEIIYSPQNIHNYGKAYIRVPTKSGTFALIEDLATKQATLYRHTVKISKPTDDGKTSITFTTSSEKNTPIDSIQDLTTVFGNTDLSVNGATYLISSSQWEFYNKIHVGTSINDTTVDYINKDDVGTYNFIDMFGTTGFTITDNVTAM